MNEARKIESMIAAVDLALEKVEQRTVNRMDEIERDPETNAPLVFQGQVDCGVFGKLTDNPQTLFERSLEFQRRHPEAFMQLGTDHGYKTVVAAFRKGHELFLKRLEKERRINESEIEVEIGTNDKDFIFDDE